MYRGIDIEGSAFFDLLMESEDFCVQLGKLTLVASRLEGELILLLRRLGEKDDIESFNMGRLIRRLKRFDSLESGTMFWLEEECQKRNYLTHNIYHLLHGIIAQTILERDDIIDSDIHTYTERAWMTQQNLLGLCELIKKHHKSV